MEYTCKQCGITFIDKPSAKRQFCSAKCHDISRKGVRFINKGSFKKGHKAPKTAFKKGQRPFNYKGWSRHPEGYIMIPNRHHPRIIKKFYVMRSILVVEFYLRRHLTPEEVVHHINEIKDDDRPENLYLFVNHSEHMRYHMNYRYGNCEKITESNIMQG